jgi:hypothetical protein
MQRVKEGENAPCTFYMCVKQNTETCQNHFKYREGEWENGGRYEPNQGTL